MNSRGNTTILLLIALLLAGLVGMMAFHHFTPPAATKFSTEYQAVLLTGGQAFYGRLEGYGTQHPVLTEIYYVQSQVNPDTKAVNNILIQRGKEWHGPDRMYLNPDHIILVEPVGANSQVAKLIAEKRGK